MDNVIELTEIEKEIIERLQNRIPYNEQMFGNKKNYELILEDIVLNARYIALSYIFPFDDYSTMELPKKYINWQYRCCIELYNLADKQGFTTYSENGLSWGKLTDGLSLQLTTELTSKVGIPKKEDEV